MFRPETRKILVPYNPTGTHWVLGIVWVGDVGANARFDRIVVYEPLRGERNHLRSLCILGHIYEVFLMVHNMQPGLVCEHNQYQNLATGFQEDKYVCGAYVMGAQWNEYDARERSKVGVWA